MADCPHIRAAVRIASVNLRQLREMSPDVKDSAKQPPYLERSSGVSRSRLGRRVSGSIPGWNCVTCGTSESPWLCLSCGLIHCGRYIKEDGLRHYNKYKEHCVCMECNTYGVFCYECDSFVGNDTDDNKIASVRSSLRFHNDSRLRENFDADDDASPFDEGTEEEELASPHSAVRGELRVDNLQRDEDSGSVPEDELSKPAVAGQPASLLGGRVLRERKRKLSAVSPSPLKGSRQKRVEIPAAPRIANRGLRNLGNTCFMNACLQGLNSCRVFSDYIRSLPPLEAAEDDEERRIDCVMPRYHTRRVSLIGASANANASEESAVLFAESLRVAFMEMATNGINAAYAPAALLEAVWKISPRFRGYQQQDAHELLRCMLDRLHMDLRRCRLPESVGARLAAAIGPAPEPVSASHSAVSLLFEGALQSRVTCLTCKTASNKQDPFLDLSLDIYVPVDGGRAGTVRLQDCIRRFFAREELDAHEQYTCGTCLIKQPSTKQLFLRSLPNVLCLHLKRFRWSHAHRGKLDNMVDFPLKDLDMHPYMCPSASTSTRSSSESTKFHLTSIVVHHGSGVSHGHYTAYGNHNGVWYHYNDSSVKPCSESAVLKQKPYILFYTRSVHATRDR